MGLKSERNGKKRWGFAQVALKERGWLKRKNKRKEERLGDRNWAQKAKDGLKRDNKKKQGRVSVRAGGKESKGRGCTARKEEKKKRGFALDAHN